MSEPMFLTDCYDQSHLDPRLFNSRLSDQALEELWGPQVKHILYHLMEHVETRCNGWLRGVAITPSFLNQTDTVYLPRFARIIERHLQQDSRVIGRKVRVMPLYEERGSVEGYSKGCLYMTEIPVVRDGQEGVAGALSTVGVDIYAQLFEVAKQCLEHILADGSRKYKWTGEWTGVLSLASVDRAYKELPSFYTALVGSMVEEMLAEQANPELEDVSCIGWDSRDTVFVTTYPGFVETPWIAYRIHPVPTIVS